MHFLKGKSIYAVPGRNLDELSRGCNRLIAQGAGIAWDPEVILEELGIAGRKVTKRRAAEMENGELKRKVDRTMGGKTDRKTGKKRG